MASDSTIYLCRLLSNLEPPERVGGGYLVVDDIIEHGANVTRMNVAGVLACCLCAERLEVGQPLHVYILERLAVYMWVKKPYAVESMLIYASCAFAGLAVYESLEVGGERTGCRLFLIAICSRFVETFRQHISLITSKSSSLRPVLSSSHLMPSNLDW